MPSDSAKPMLRICWLKDQRPGHLTKAKGVIKALSRHREVEVEEIRILWRPSFLRRLARWLPGFLWPFCLENSPTREPDLIVSAGGATEWANAHLARKFDVPNIYLGTCRCCAPEDFSVLPRIDAGESSNVLEMDIVPSEIDPALVRVLGETELALLTGRYWTVLLGGNGSGCVWTPEDWQAQCRRIVVEAEAAGVQLIVTSSPRTGAGAERVCRQVFEESNGLALGVWFSERNRSQPPSIAAMLGRAERVIVTEDSASMVNEAVAAGKPVATIAPRDSRPEVLIDTMLNRLAERGRIVRLVGRDWCFGPAPDSHWFVMKGDWHDDLGRALLERISLFKAGNEH